jgi:two-component system OmpR family response regulator
MGVLVIEDDADTASYIINGLKESGYEVDHAMDGDSGVKLALEKNYNIMIIDRMLPGINGLNIVETIRDNGIKTPVLFLSALADIDDRVAGLKSGGDDYLTKPFAMVELLARLEALIRRTSQQTENTFLKVNDIEMDILARTVTRQGKRVYLHPREFKLLEYLLRNANQVVTRTMLLENVWEYHFDPQTNVIDVHISRLRQKIDRPFEKPILKTIRGDGYMIEVISSG